MRRSSRGASAADEKRKHRADFFRSVRCLRLRFYQCSELMAARASWGFCRHCTCGKEDCRLNSSPFPQSLSSRMRDAREAAEGRCRRRSTSLRMGRECGEKPRNTVAADDLHLVFAHAWTWRETAECSRCRDDLCPRACGTREKPRSAVTADDFRARPGRAGTRGEVRLVCAGRSVLAYHGMRHAAEKRLCAHFQPHRRRRVRFAGFCAQHNRCNL